MVGWQPPYVHTRCRKRARQATPPPPHTLPLTSPSLSSVSESAAAEALPLSAACPASGVRSGVVVARPVAQLGRGTNGDIQKYGPHII